uniref:Aromatic amino acid beta-eliminating lyase/threonine aldolase domain-containing protein n=1 Tax=Calidris pygmaea TaxID=425635 RepID=A0A8C3J5Y3_9CHAR
MCHCQRRGGQLLLGRDAHLHVYEHGGAAQVGAASTGGLWPGLPGARRTRWHRWRRQGPEGGFLLPSSGCRDLASPPGLRHHPDHPEPQPGHKFGLSTPGAGEEGTEGAGTPTQCHRPPTHRHRPPSPLLSALPRAQVAGVHSQALPDLPDGTFDLDQLEMTIREAHGSRYHPRPELICLENTHSSAGGRVLPLAYLRQVRGLADRYGLRVHMDGARLMNAAVAQDVEPARITQHCDSVTLCFSKGLGAPAGAVVAGRREFVAEAWRVRKLLGGGMRQAGVLATAARVGLEQAAATLRRDHHNARRFAEGTPGLLGTPGRTPCSARLRHWVLPCPTAQCGHSLTPPPRWGVTAPSTSRHCRG